MMSVSITELIWQAKSWGEIKTGSEKSELGMYSPQFTMTPPWDINDVALPRGSTRCQPSIEIWMRLLQCCGTEWELNLSGDWQSAIFWSPAFLMVSTCVPLLIKTQRNTPVGTLLKLYVKNILMIDSVLSLKHFFDLYYNFLKFLSDVTLNRMSVWICIPNALTKEGIWT
jgi:hypothetical protein